MKKRLLPETVKTPVFYINKEQQSKKIKLNVLLVVAVVIVCIAIHLSDKNNGSGFTESNKNHYFDTPKHLKASNLYMVQVA
ncbi:MAG: hypothetical protein JWR50_1078 [Mucilaginibacter sp.]|nr:hypothetical protein [Mucilaginibacter sp.]